jgi:hypothetical protein
MSFVVLAAFAVPVYAITAGDVLDRMGADQRSGYLTGAVDMAMYLASAQEKNNAKAECIMNWYYGKNGPGPRDVIATFDRYPDRPAIGLIKLLIDRHCGQAK